MKSYYVNRQSLKDDLNKETLTFYTLYLFAEASWYHSFLSHYVLLWKQQADWTERLIVELYNYYNPDQDSSREKTNEMYRMIKKIRGEKHKNKQALNLINQFNSFLVIAKNLVISSLKNFFIKEYLWEWLDLFDKDVAFLYNYRPSGVYKDNEEDQVSKDLKSAFNQYPEEFLFLNYFVPQALKKTAIAEEKEIENEEALPPDAPGYYAMPLFSYPYCQGMPIENMKMVRANMLAKMQNISDMLIKFKTDMHKEIFDSSIHEECNLFFYNQLKPETENMQKHIDNELYFMQAQKSLEKYLRLTLNIGVTSVSSIIFYYEQAGILQPHVAHALNEQLSNYFDTAKCDVFLYWCFEVKNFEY